MLEIKNKQLIGKLELKSADTLITLKADLDCVYQAQVTFSNGEETVITFVKKNDYYVARLILTEDMAKGLSLVLLQCIMISDILLEKTNSITVKADREQISLDIKKNYNNELNDLRKQIRDLQAQLNALTSSKILQGLNITNLDYVKQGMIPVAIDNKGNFIVCDPFIMHVQKVNNQEPVNGLVNIDASMIEYKANRTVKEAIDEHVKAIIAQNNSIKQLTETVKQLANRLDQLTIDFETYKNSGIL